MTLNPEIGLPLLHPYLPSLGMRHERNSIDLRLDIRLERRIDMEPMIESTEDGRHAAVDEIE